MIECFDESDETNNNKSNQLTDGCLAATIICIFLTLGFFVLMYYLYYFKKQIKNLNNDLDACNKSKNDFIKRVSSLNSIINEYSQKSDSCDNTVKDLQTKLNNFYNEYYRIKGYL